MTHDSIGLGEDGPTHQPVEHLAALRAIPNVTVLRPADAIETAECWQVALERMHGPSILALTRQGLPTVRTATDENLSARGAYILKECEGAPEVTIFASGSEVEIAIEAAMQLGLKGTQVRVVSVPSLDLFQEQDGSYIEELTCNGSIKVAVEAGVRQGWDSLIGPHGIFVGMSTFGESAPADILYKHFNITPEAIVARVQARLDARKEAS